MLAARGALAIVLGAICVCACAGVASASSTPGVVGSAFAVKRSAASACGSAKLVCTTVSVPLDRSGIVAGTVALHVEKVPSTTFQRPVVFLVAGGPGQGSAQTFDLSSTYSRAIYQFLFPGYTLVAYDDRGTGKSGALDCSALRSGSGGTDAMEIAADCAAELGSGAAYYSTADHAADLEAVRQSLGVDRITIMGVSYGTKLALTYAAAYPAHVERLVLDSVAPPGQDTSYATDVLQAMPQTLGRYCPAESCAQATPNFAGDVVALANALAAGAFQTRATGSTAGQHDVALTFLRRIIDADLNPGLAAELPAAVHAARSGYLRPLTHLFALGGIADGATEPSEFSSALYLATVCDDTPFPWQAMPMETRQAALQEAIDALPVGSFGPFDRWAAGLGDATVCAGWPTPANDVTPPTGPLPDVPVLAFSGALDLRTPTAGAAGIIAQFPRGRLVVAGGVGHAVLSMDPSGCAQLILHGWIKDGRLPPAACNRVKPYIAPLAAFPSPSAKRLTAAQTRTVATKTLHDAEAAWLATAGLSGTKTTITGLYGGNLVATRRDLRLNRYSIASGVTVSGTIHFRAAGPPLTFRGSVVVAGKNAARIPRVYA
jgi:pimeloyl-ACP methyl ester carboxylesterase